MENDKAGESEKSINTPGQENKPRYRKSRKGVGGRPSKDDQFQRQIVINFIEYLIKEGASDAEIARSINVPYTSFTRWKKKHPEFWLELVKNSEITDTMIVTSLKKRALGFSVKQPIYDKKGEVKEIRTLYYPPSESAIQYYLNNRMPADWKSKVEHNHAIEELPLAINFVRASSKKSSKAITDDFGNIITMSDDENQGSSRS